jgi:hypothetical protein
MAAAAPTEACALFLEDLRAKGKALPDKCDACGVGTLAKLMLLFGENVTVLNKERMTNESNDKLVFSTSIGLPGYALLFISI